MSEKTLANYLVSVHQRLNPNREKFLKTLDIMPTVLDEVYSNGTAISPDRTIGTTYLRNPDMFEKSSTGKWRLTEKAHNFFVDHTRVIARLINKIKKSENKKISKLLLEANDELSKVKEGGRRTATRKQIVRSQAVRKLSLIFHGNTCSVCSRKPEDFGPEYTNSMMEVHHINELHTYEDKGITETDIRTDTAVVCAPCHRCNIHLAGSLSAKSIDDARKTREKALRG